MLLCLKINLSPMLLCQEHNMSLRGSQIAIVTANIFFSYNFNIFFFACLRILFIFVHENDIIHVIVLTQA